MPGFLAALFAALITLPAFSSETPNFVQLQARDKFERSRIVDLGVSVDAVLSDSVYATVSDEILDRLVAAGVKVVETFPVRIKDFPREDSRFHNYDELTRTLDAIVALQPRIMRKFSIGRSVQGREIWAVQINTSPSARRPRDASTVSAKPGVVFLGTHHAREHVSTEVPLMLLQFLAENYGVDRDLTSLIEKRDIYVIPLVNPDGAEYDIATGQYRMHRKNMRQTNKRNPGVDLNRNYGFHWGAGGASSDPGNDTYKGPAPFSEPETVAVKTFLESRPNVRTLLSYHTYSELILYPWGWTYDPVTNGDDKLTFETMARQMAAWSGYRPQQSSDLYIAAGDTVDWAYGALGIFSFTFELSPKSRWDGGFYPGAKILDRVFQDNLKPALYLIELADNPHRARMGRGEAVAWQWPEY